MATFVGQAAKQGQGATYWLDVSFDKFATVAYRWGLRGGLLDGANMYEDRIAKLGRYSKAFSPDRLAGSGSIDVQLHNVDRGVDWMVDQATSYQVFYARARLYMGLYDKSSSAAPANLVSKKLGEFVISYFPERDADYVRFTLSDDLLGILNQPISTPTLDDWTRDAGSDATNCPMHVGGGTGITDFLYQINRYEMLPLQFGSDPAWLRPIGKSDPPQVSKLHSLLACVTTETGLNTAVSWSGDNMQLFISFGPGGAASLAGGGVAHVYGGVNVPNTWTSKGVTLATLWTAKVSQLLTKNGRNFIVLYIEFDAESFAEWFIDKYAFFSTVGGGQRPQWYGSIETREALWDSVQSWLIQDAPNTTAGIKLSGRSQYAVKTHAADVIYDLAVYYSTDGTAAYIDTASFDRARKEVGWALASGIIHPGIEQTSEEKLKGIAPPTRSTLREHVTGICQSCDVDVFITWDGTIALSSLWFDYNASTGLTSLFSIDEERTGAQLDATPSVGDRHAPYNRILLSDLKKDFLSGNEVWSAGPYDNPDAGAQDWKVKLETTWRVGWTPFNRYGGNPWYSRNAEQKVRPRFAFITDVLALANLDLGAFFLGNWSRNYGASAPYTGAVFQTEEISIDPSDDRVDMAGIWRDEVQTDKPYLLDDETLLARATGNGGRTVTVVDASSNVHFSSGSLITDAVAINDHLILKDAGEAENSFKRNKVLVITAIVDLDDLTVSDPIDGLDFGGGGTFAGWEIRKSERTYPTAGTDPVNYPDGSTMYGKVASSMTAGTYSDGLAGNKLLSG